MLEIIFSDFDEKDISILDVQEKENRIYNVIVNFNTNKYKENLSLEKCYKINVEGRITLSYKKSSNKFKLDNYLIENVSFDYSINNLWHTTLGGALKKFATALCSNTIVEAKHYLVHKC